MQEEQPIESRLRPGDDRQHRGRERMAECQSLETTRLMLRLPDAKDIDALAHLANNFKVAMMLSRMPHPYTTADAADFVTRARQGEIGKRVFAITKKDNGAFLGCCGIEPQADGRTMELGYWLGEAHWNKGYATEAAHALVDLAFHNPAIECVDARCRVMNVASRRVIQKCGLQFQGTGMSPSLSIGGALPVEWYRLDRSTWSALKSWRTVQ